jgi:hypothetical protein
VFVLILSASIPPLPMAGSVGSSRRARALREQPPVYAAIAPARLAEHRWEHVSCAGAPADWDGMPLRRAVPLSLQGDH